MKYLNDDIARKAKNRTTRSLIKKGVSCGIFQELGVDASQQKSKKVNNSAQDLWQSK